MKRFFHKIFSRAVDEAAFGSINLLQKRARAGSHTLAEFHEYFARWQGASVEDMFCLPDGIEIPKIPQSGQASYRSSCQTDRWENNSLHIQVWPGPQGLQSPAMLLLHGFMSVSDKGYHIWAKHLNRLGWTAVFFDLPYHYHRCPSDTVSGEIALSANLIRTVETIRQGVMDLRLVTQGLREAGAPEVGCWATSYGGWMAALLGVVEPALSTLWLVEPIADVEHAVWQSPATRTLRKQLKARGIRREDTLPYIPLVCPSYHSPLVDPKNILIVGGEYDRITPPDRLRRLTEKWKGSHFARIRQGHVGYRLMPASWRLAMDGMPHLFPGSEAELAKEVLKR